MYVCHMVNPNNKNDHLDVHENEGSIRMSTALRCRWRIVMWVYNGSLLLLCLMLMTSSSVLSTTAGNASRRCHIDNPQLQKLKCERSWNWRMSKALRCCKKNDKVGIRRVVIQMLLCLMLKSSCVLSTTAGSAARRCAANVHPSAPPSPSWALSLRCVCVTAATSPSPTRSE